MISALKMIGVWAIGSAGSGVLVWGMTKNAWLSAGVAILGAGVGIMRLAFVLGADHHDEADDLDTSEESLLTGSKEMEKGDPAVNPTTGLPMLNPGVDISGRPLGD